jgi:hypothetical protein
MKIRPILWFNFPFTVIAIMNFSQVPLVFNLLYTLGSEEEGKDSNENNYHENYDDTGKKIHQRGLFSPIFPLLRLSELQ